MVKQDILYFLKDYYLKSKGRQLDDKLTDEDTEAISRMVQVDLDLENGLIDEDAYRAITSGEPEAMLEYIRDHIIDNKEFEPEDRLEVINMLTEMVIVEFGEGGSEDGE